MGEPVFRAGLGAQQSDLQARGPVRLLKAGQLLKGTSVWLDLLQEG